MELTTTAFIDGGVIPVQFAFGAMDPEEIVRLSDNRNPDLAWRDVPAGTRSLALICHDPDVPSVGEDVNQEGKTVPADLPRVDFFHWLLVDLAPDAAPIAAGEFSDGIVVAGKPGPSAPRGLRQGVNDYTGWFASDPVMAGDYHGYDGPCPPWNDARPHRYVFTLYALDVERLDLPEHFTGIDLRTAMEGHVLAQASLTGRYTLNPEVTL